MFSKKYIIFLIFNTIVYAHEDHSSLELGQTIGSLSSPEIENQGHYDGQDENLSSSEEPGVEDEKNDLNNNDDKPKSSWYTRKLPIVLAVILPTILRMNKKCKNRAAKKTESTKQSKVATFETQPTAVNTPAKLNEKERSCCASPLSDYTVDLTAKAKAKASAKDTNTLGRQEEINRVIEFLGLKTNNNVILVRDPGVEKTAVVEGLAMAIVQGKVSEKMKAWRVLSLDLELLKQGTRYQVEVSDRLKTFVKALQDSQEQVILFIDDIHRLETENIEILKPVVNLGRVIVATDTDNHAEFMRKPNHLHRQFNFISVEEPSQEDTLEILRRLKNEYESYHNVKIDDQALMEAVRLSLQYLPDLRFPDKAIRVIDLACSHLRLQIGTESTSSTQESQQIGPQEVASAVASLSRIPVGQITKKDADYWLHLEKRLGQKIFGQKHALQVLSKAIRRAKTGLTDPHRPWGIFLFLGPSGVGKTETAKILAEELFQSRTEFLVRIDMSEYMDAHQTSRLLGAAPGLIGYGEGGQLTEPIRRRPHSIVLLDEIEKAHESVLDLFLQLFDDGHLTDSQGRKVDFRHTLIIMTSNLCRDLHETGDDVLRQKLAKHLRPEFIGRIDECVLFKPLGESHFSQLLGLCLKTLNEQLASKNVHLSLGSQLISSLFNEWQKVSSREGARALQRLFENQITSTLATHLLENPEFQGEWIMNLKTTDGNIDFKQGREDLKMPTEIDIL